MKKLQLPVFSFIVFILFSAFSSQPTRLGDFYNYNFGLFNFLEIRRNDKLSSNLNIINVANGCDNFSLNLFSLIGSLFITVIFSYGLIKAIAYLRRAYDKKLSGKA